jgi:hypothetical protein
MPSSLDRQKKVATAVLMGLAWVNLPVLLIMFGGWVGFLILAGNLGLKLHFTPAVNLVLGLGFFACGAILPWVAAWLWWSINVPKWRIWALAFARDWPALEPQAVQAGLLWSERTWFGRLCASTEIWTRDDRDKFAALKRAGSED